MRHIETIGDFGVAGNTSLRRIELVRDGIGKSAAVNLPLAPQIKTIWKQSKPGQKLFATEVQLNDMLGHMRPLVGSSVASNRH